HSTDPVFGHITCGNSMACRRNCASLTLHQTRKGMSEAGDGTTPDYVPARRFGRVAGSMRTGREQWMLLPQMGRDQHHAVAIARAIDGHHPPRKRESAFGPIPIDR